MADRQRKQSQYMRFGKHKGMSIRKVPVGYLRWMPNTQSMDHDMAGAELLRRGIAFDEVEFSYRAIEEATSKHLKLFIATRREHEGIRAWLLRFVTGAMKGKDVEKNELTTYYFHGVEVVVSYATLNPTVVALGKPKQDEISGFTVRDVPAKCETEPEQTMSSSLAPTPPPSLHPAATSSAVIQRWPLTGGPE